MSTLTMLRPLSVEEYLESESRSDDKHEFVAGEVYAMIGTSRVHNRIAGKFYAKLLAHLDGTACTVFMLDMKLRVGGNFYYPDLLVTCDPADSEPLFVTRPRLIVEVLSPGTALRDTREKLSAYQSIETLQEYVLAEQERREVRIYRRTGAGWTLAAHAGGAPVELAAIDLALPLDDIYGGILP